MKVTIIQRHKCYLDVYWCRNGFNIVVFVCPAAWLHSSAPGGPAGTHRHCNIVAETWSSAQRDNNGEHEHTIFLKMIHKVRSLEI